jgi:hypothetical protein
LGVTPIHADDRIAILLQKSGMRPPSIGAARVSVVYTGPIIRRHCGRVEMASPVPILHAAVGGVCDLVGGHVGVPFWQPALMARAVFQGQRAFLISAAHQLQIEGRVRGQSFPHGRIVKLGQQLTEPQVPDPAAGDAEEQLAFVIQSILLLLVQVGGA